MFRRSCGNLRTREPADVAARDEHTPLGGDFVTEQELEQRRFPRTRGPDEEHELALGDIEVDLTQGDDVALVGLADVLESNHESLMKVPAGSPPAGVARDRLAGPSPFATSPPLQVRLDEHVEVAVDHRLHIAGLGACSLVFHELVGHGVYVRI